MGWGNGRERLFRALIVLSVVMGLVPSIARVIDPALVPRSGLFNHWTLAELVAGFVGGLVVFLASIVGIFRFKWWARYSYTVLVAATSILSVFDFSSWNTHFQIFACAIETVLEIALLALMWASPLKERFRRPPRRPAAPVPPTGSLAEWLFTWPRNGWLLLASVCAAIVGTACAPPFFVGVFVLGAIAGKLPDASNDPVMRLTIVSLAIQHVLKDCALWVLISFLLFPLIRFGLALPVAWTRWSSVAMGAAVPFLLLLAAEFMSPQFKVGDLFVIPIFGGIPAALVFGEIVGYGPVAAASVRNWWGEKSRISVLAFSLLCLAGLLFVCQQGWSGGGMGFPVRAEWHYRLRHPTWPIWCSSLSNVRLFPRFDPLFDSDDAICRSMADQGDAVAQLMAADGKFGSVSPTERLAWLTKAAEQDYGPAETALGSMLGPFAADEGVPKDAEKAAQWERRAAIQGSITSRAMVAIFYARGDRGLPQDKVESLMWREILARSEDDFFNMKPFRDNFEKYKATLTPEDVAEAHRRAEAFLASH